MINSYERLERMLRNDKLHLPKMVEEVIKNDLIKVLSNYMQIDQAKCEFSIKVQGNDKIFVVFEGEADKLISPKCSR